MNEQLLVDLVERLRGRVYGKYRGTVVEVEQGGRGRLKAKVPAVLGEQTTGWCDPCVPYAGKDVGFAFLPEVGAGVWIEFEGGDVSHPIWAGCYWREGELPADVQPATKVLRTAKGHQLLMDDDGESVTLQDSNGNTVTLDSAGITLVRGSQKVEITESKVSVNGSALEIV